MDNKIEEDNKKRYNDALDQYEKIIKEERNKVKNSYSIINKLRAELDYIKDENLKLLKLISENNRNNYKLINFDEDRILKEENEDININKKETDENNNNIKENNESNKNIIINNEDISFRNFKNKTNNTHELYDNGNTIINNDIKITNSNKCEENNDNKTYEMNYNNNNDNGINTKYMKYEEIFNLNNKNNKKELIDIECYNEN